MVEISVILSSLGNVYLSSQAFSGMALLNGCHIGHKGHQEEKMLLLLIRKYNKSLGKLEFSIRGDLCYTVPSCIRDNVEMKICDENLEGCNLSCSS